MKVAGKTGTALADEGPWTHAWFAGYAPAENPEIVLVVFLEKGHGGTDAASVAREIFAAFAADHAPGSRSRKGSAEMKRLLAAIGLLLLLCAAGDAELGDHAAAKASPQWISADRSSAALVSASAARVADSRRRRSGPDANLRKLAKAPPSLLPPCAPRSRGLRSRETNHPPPSFA